MIAVLAMAGLVIGVTLVLVFAGRRMLADPGVGDMRKRLEVLHRQVVAWQAAHDHQVASLDRRMRDVETAAARAEEEARIVSVQMADLTRHLIRRMDQIDQRNEIERLAAQGRILDGGASGY